jgi:uncharacterized protein YndB with AHSA1/START domain
MRWLLIVLAVLVTGFALIFMTGAALPVTHTAAVRVYVAAPPDTVFALITDPMAATSWRSDVDRVEILTRAAHQLRWRETTSMGPIILAAEELQPPVRFVTRIDDPDQPFGGRWIHVLEPSRGGTLVTMTEQGEVYSPLFRFMARFIFGHHATLERYARDLAHHFGTDGRVERVRSDSGP